MRITLENIHEYLSTDGLEVSTVYPITRQNHFRTIKELEIELSDFDIITIPKGFEFDGSSSPRFLWWLFPSYGDFLFAALIHDWMYKTDYKRKTIGTYRARLFADNEMLVWSDTINQNYLDNKIRYLAVRIFGKKFYAN